MEYLLIFIILGTTFLLAHHPTNAWQNQPAAGATQGNNANLQNVKWIILGKKQYGFESKVPF
jgi:hypothetical protein